MAKKKKVTKLEFKRTGFWWTDLGIVALQDSLEAHKTKGLSLVLNPSSLIVEGDQKVIREAIGDVRESLKEMVWGETKEGKMWWKGPGLFFFKQYGGGPDTLPIAHDKFEKGRGMKSGVCDFCGAQEVVRSIGTSENPLIVTLDRMVTFYSSGKGSVNMCWNCTLASACALGKFGIFFNRHDGFIDIFCYEGSDLQDLKQASRVLSKLRAIGLFASHHVPREFYNARYPLEDFFGFIIHMWRNLKKRELADVMRGRRFHVLQAELAGRAVSINRYYVIPDVSRFLSLLNIVGEDLLPMVGNFYIQRDGETDTLDRENLSRRMLWGADICDIVEDFLYATLNSELEKYFYRSCDRVVSEYEKEVMKIEPELLEDCKGLGRTLGRLASDKEDKDVLYALRSARNLDDLLATLHRIFTRYAEEIKVYAKGLEGILQKVDDKNWRRYKSLIGIWAVLSYQMEKGER